MLLLCTVILLASSGQIRAKISINAVQEWASALDGKLWEWGEATKWRELKARYTNKFEIRYKDRILVKEIAENIHNLTQLKTSAVRRIVKNAETIALRLYKDVGDVHVNLTYFGTKTSDPADETLHNVSRLDCSPNSHFPGEVVNLTHSSVHVPTNVFHRAQKILKVINWTNELESTFISNYEHDPSLSWQYFGSSTGIMRQYPGVFWDATATKVDMFDCRLRLWYIEASLSPKDVVILVDNSGSMTGRRHEIAHQLVNSILETLGSNDFVSVVKFTKESKPVMECFGHELVQATLGTVREFKLAMKSVVATNQADFRVALTTAFDMLQKAHNESTGACCKRAIMLITDGIPDIYKDIFIHYNLKDDMHVRMFTYLIGKEEPVIREMQWIACNNNGYFVPLKTMSEVRESVLNYMPVMSRPLVLLGERPINWTPLYTDVADPRLTDWLWIQRENEEQYEVSQFCYFPKKNPTRTYNATGKVYRNCSEEPQIKRAQDPSWSTREYYFITSISMPVLDVGENKTKTAQILGVAGTDVPIEDIKKLLLPHRVGVNGYAFIITNNGHILIHPDHRPEFLGILKPNYNSVDLTEVELVDDDSNETRTLDPQFLELRKAMINQEYGKKTLHMKYHYDNMRRVSNMTRHYQHIGIKDTPFTVGIALPTSYGLFSVHVTPEAAKFVTSKNVLRPGTKEYKEITIFLKEFYQDRNWTVHPEWVYCKYHYDAEHEFNSSEDELRNFLGTLGSDCRTGRLLTPPELLNPPYPKVNKNSCFCDQDLFISLMQDARETKKWSKRDIRDILRTEEFGATLMFVATHSGLTRWLPLKDDLETNDFKDRNVRAIDEIWYQRAVELYETDGSFVYSVPFSSEQGDDINIQVTATLAIFAEFKKDKVRVPIAVVGYRFSHIKLYEMFLAVTGKCSVPGCVPCSSDDLRCYILDNNGYIVVSYVNAETGKFFGEVEGLTMSMMIEEGIFRKIHIFDYQAICLRDDDTSSHGPIFITPVYHALQIFEWIIGTVFWLFTQTSLWHDSWSHAAKVKPTQIPRDDVKIVRTHLEPCIKQLDLYRLQKDSYPSSKFGWSNCKDPKPNENPTPFVVQKLHHSNLILVVIDTLCSGDTWTQVRVARTEVGDSDLAACLKGLNANLTRRRPKTCVGRNEKEPPVAQCCCDSQMEASIFPLLICWCVNVFTISKCSL